MRKYKFRAWNKATSKMMSWNDIRRFRNLDKLLTLDHIILQQFTGLLDKNGKEIYEGDIISDVVETDEGLKQSFEQIYFEEKEGCYKLDNSLNQDKLSGIILAFELIDFDYIVVGNIYENPELLNNVKK